MGWVIGASMIARSLRARLRQPRLRRRLRRGEGFGRTRVVLALWRVRARYAIGFLWWRLRLFGLAVWLYGLSVVGAGRLAGSPGWEWLFEEGATPAEALAEGARAAQDAAAQAASEPGPTSPFAPKERQLSQEPTRGPEP